MTAPSIYFVNRWVDWAMIGGLSLITWAVLSVVYAHSDNASLTRVALALSLVVNFPHFSATVYRLYQKPDNLRQFPVTACGLPFIIIGGIAASLWQPQLIAPYFILLYVLWSPYHFSGQTVGITMLYARRCGFPIGPRQRLALSGFVFATLLCSLARVAENGPTPFYGIPVPPIYFPNWLDWGVEAAMYVSAAVFIGFVVQWCRAEKRLLPPIVLLPAVSQFVWFVPGAGLKSFLLVIPMFHSMQYLLIAAMMQISLRLHDSGGERSWQRVRYETVRWGVRNVVGGAVLFLGIPPLLFWTSVPLGITAGIIAAAINIHHFFVDGVIWKLRDPATSKALGVNIADLAGAPRGILAAPGIAA